VTGLFAAVRALMQTMDSLRRVGDSSEIQDQLITFPEFNRFIGLPAVQEMEQRYTVPD
jgi:hypothetical protein